MIVAIITLAAEKIQRRQVPGFIAETQRVQLLSNRNHYPATTEFLQSI